jgi:predicted RNA binding protein YcfA (HicA-like mRNA interferase family)
MKSLSGKQLVRILEQRGWMLLRIQAKGASAIKEEYN